MTSMLRRAVLGLGAALLLATAGGPARGEIVDIPLTVVGGNIPSVDEFGDPDNVVFLIPLVPAGSEIIGIGWDVTLTAFSPSWLSELVLLISDSGGNLDDAVALAPGFADDFSGTATYSSGGVILLSDVPLPNILLDDGVVRFEFFEGFDDAPDDVDGEWFVDSVITLRVNVVPEPSSVALSLSGLGVLGLVGLRRSRRRAAGA